MRSSNFSDTDEITDGQTDVKFEEVHTLSQKMIHPATTETVIKPAIFRMNF